MYLEETIEALEVQEDSGLSNDEPDPGRQAAKMACHFPAMGQMKMDGNYHSSSECLDIQSSVLDFFLVCEYFVPTTMNI